jgi:hypothetical protein
MANVAYSVFFPLIAPLLPKVPEPTLELAVKNACIEFCKGTLCWQEQMDPLTVIANEASYEMDTPTGAALTMPVELYFGGNRLFKRTPSEISSKFTRDWQLLRGTPSAYTQFNPNEVMLVLCPESTMANALTGTLAFQPSRASTTVPDFLYEEYAEQIVAGAAARLYAIPNEPFTDQKAALAYARQFRSDIANTRASMSQGLLQAPKRVAFRGSW